MPASYDVTVLDSSASFHGPTDTRVSKPGGIGRGVFRIYVGYDSAIAGYTWSTVNGSNYMTPPAGYRTGLGRWIP